MLYNQITDFLFHLKFPAAVPPGVQVLSPFQDPDTKRVCKQFYQKFYADNAPRFCIIGINPGRFGGGVTGIPFTDPIRLKTVCGIENPWPAKQELSSVFIYKMIEAFGGPVSFYSHFYITSVSPLGFTKDGKNLNYYDDKDLQTSIRPFVVDSMHQQLSWGLARSTAFCFGEGKNFRYLFSLNQEVKFFEQIIPLPHPRFIMQYKLKSLQSYIDRYLDAFTSVLSS